jgi:hypothetical protein
MMRPALPQMIRVGAAMRWHHTAYLWAVGVSVGGRWIVDTENKQYAPLGSGKNWRSECFRGRSTWANLEEFVPEGEPMLHVRRREFLSLLGRPSGSIVAALGTRAAAGQCR